MFACRSEMLFLSLFFTDPVLRTFLYVLTTVVWPMMMEAFDVIFYGKSVSMYILSDVDGYRTDDIIVFFTRL